MEKEAVNAIFEKLASDAVLMHRAEKAEKGELEKKAGGIMQGLKNYAKQIPGAQAAKNNPGTAAALGLGATGTAAGGYGAYKGREATQRQQDVVGPALGQLYGQAAKSQTYDKAQNEAIEHIVNRKQQLQQELQALDQQQNEIEGQVGMEDQQESRDYEEESE